MQIIKLQDNIAMCVHCHHCSGEVLMVTWCILITYLHFDTTITQNIPGLLCVKRLGAD